MIRLLQAACVLLFLLGSLRAQTALDPLQRSILDRTLFLENGSIRVGVCPQVGRIVWLSAGASGNNLLWLNTAGAFAETRAAQGWSNWGGDKLWPAAQSDWKEVMGWRWPPDPVLDGLSWTLLHQDRLSCLIESRRSPYWGVMIRRRIALHARKPQVEIVNTLTRVADCDWPVTIWPVTQAMRPDYLLLHAASGQPDRAPRWVDLGREGSVAIPAEAVRLLDGSIHYEPPHEPATKLGTAGRWIAAVYPGLVFLQEARQEIDTAADYADGAAAQLYANRDFVEIELLSPIRALGKGQRLEHVLRWHVIPLEPDDRGGDAVLQRVAAALGEP